MKGNCPDFLANVCRAVYEEDPIGFDIERAWREFNHHYARMLLKSVARSSKLDEYLLAQANAYTAHLYEGGLYQSRRRSTMKDLWNRLSAKGKETAIKATLYVVWIVVFWFLGQKHLMTPATAFFGLAVVTAVFAALYWFVKTKILGK